MQEERKKLTSVNLALVLVHDLLLSDGIQAGDGPIKQAVLRHRTRMHGELQRIKIKRGITLNSQLAQGVDRRAGHDSSLRPERDTEISRLCSNNSTLYSSQHSGVDNRRRGPVVRFSGIPIIRAL